MLIETIPGDYIINATMKCLWTLQSDFVIKAIKIKNDMEHPVTLRKITFALKAEG